MRTLRFAIALGVLLTACSGSTPTAPAPVPVSPAAVPTSTSAPPAATPVAPTATVAPPPTPVPPTATVPPSSTPTPTLGYKLAAIQSQGAPATNDPLVGQMQQAVRIQQIMSGRGVQESILSILTHVAGAVPAGASPMKCDQVFAAYATLRAPAQ